MKKRKVRKSVVVGFIVIVVATAVLCFQSCLGSKTILAQLPPSTSSQMSGYVLSDGETTIVVDGGTAGDKKALISEIQKLSNDDTVDAWLITHYHQDHTGALASILEEKDSPIKIDEIVADLPPEDLTAQYDASRLADYQTIDTALSQYDQVLIPQQGQTLDIGSFTVEVLQIPDLSVTDNFGNNSSVVYKVVTEAGEQILFLGDSGVESGRRLLEGSRSAIENMDYVQMAHHGQAGVEQDVYQVINPKYCLWPTPDWLWDADRDDYQTKTTREWIDALPVKKNYVAKDGLIEIALKE